MSADSKTHSSLQEKWARLRLPNGVISAIILVFFVCHAALGAAWRCGIISGTLAAAVWVAIALAGVHIALCVATSYSMLADKVRPPSSKKKQHLLLKWITGGIVVALVLVHIAFIQSQGGGKAAGMEPLVIMLIVLAALAVHSWTGIKSLLKDLNVNRKWRTPLRIVIVAACAIIGIILCL